MADGLFRDVRVSTKVNLRRRTHGLIHSVPQIASLGQLLFLSRDDALGSLKLLLDT